VEKIMFNHFDINDENIYNVIDLVDTSVYRKDTDGHYLGCNKYVVSMVGLKSRNQIIGKTDYHIFSKNAASRLREIDKLVMEKGSYQGEEYALHTNGEQRVYFTVKNQLLDEQNNVIGIIGTSIDITKQKEAEQLRLKNQRLEIENRTQKIVIELEEHKKFRQIVDQMAHDLGSPLMVLSVLTDDLDSSVPERERLILRECAIRIRGIAESLLSRYRMEEQESTANSGKLDELLVSTALEQLIIDKQFEYQNLPVKFTFTYNSGSSFS
jgi:PAS domain S-box-containing protein